MGLVIFDLDGTLADISHRLDRTLLADKTEGTHLDLSEYLGDRPIGHVISLYRLHLRNGLNRPHIWSARRARSLDVTTEWINQHVITALDWSRHLRMRPTEDRTPDDELKERWLHEVRAAGQDVELAYEDRTSVVKMWRRNGVPCFQVADGDY